MDFWNTAKHRHARIGTTESMCSTSRRTERDRRILGQKMRLREIDRLIERKEKLLTEIETYKKSLIFEYVTGKKEVPV